MNKFTVTDELSSLIKSLRVKSKVTAKALSAAIKKSPSYISKLENREIHSISEEELTAILDQIIDGDTFYDTKLSIIIQTFLSFFGAEKMPEQLWLLNYDIRKRPIVVDEASIDDMNSRLEKLGITRDLLLDQINSNRDSALSDAFPSNELFEYDLVRKNHQFLLIRIHVEPDELNEFLDKHNTTTHYYLVNSIVYTIIRAEKYSMRKMTVDEARNLLHAVDLHLKSYNVVSLTDYYKILMIKNDMGTQQNFLTALNDSNHEVLADIFSIFRAASENDLLACTNDMEAFLKNLTWDQAFMFKLICFPFNDLEPISFNLKKQFLNDVEKLLRKYQKIPESQRTFENY